MRGNPESAALASIFDHEVADDEIALEDLYSDDEPDDAADARASTYAELQLGEWL